jgi:hypothetical protein
MMDSITDLPRLRRALLLKPNDPERWQELIEWITNLGGGQLLGDIDDLFVTPLSQPDHAHAVSLPGSVAEQILEQGLQAHRIGDRAGLQLVIGRLENHDQAHPWLHGLRGLRGEMGGGDGYAEFSRALEREPSNAWFRYWKSMAALRRRDWIDFSYEALLLTSSETIEHQSLVLAAIYHLIAAAIVQLEPQRCQENDIRVFDLAHPDRICHTTEDLISVILRFFNKERRKMIRILLDHIDAIGPDSCGHGLVLHHLQDQLRWRVIGLAEPTLSASLFAALQARLQALPMLWSTPVEMASLLPQRPGLAFGEDRIRIWSDYKLRLGRTPQ